MLFERGQDLNEGKENDLWYPLHWAAYYNRIETGRFLLENGARIDLVTKDGSRPIHFAALQGHAEFIRLLIEFGEKPDIKQPSGMFILFFLNIYMLLLLITIIIVLA